MSVLAGFVSLFVPPMRQTLASASPLVLALLQSLMEMNPNKIRREADRQASHPDHLHISKPHRHEHNQYTTIALHIRLHHPERQSEREMAAERPAGRARDKGRPPR